MIIHNPKISGSLQFPSDENGNLITLQVQNGTLETLTLNSSGVDQNVQPSVNYSGSFTGSFVGDGSSLTGIAATSFNIDSLGALGSAIVAQADNFLISDDGTEKKVTFSNLEDSIFGNVSGDITIAAGGAATLASIANSKLTNDGITIAGVDTSLGGTITLETITGGSGIQSGSILNADLANSAITISGTSVSLGGAITDETLFGGTSVVSGSAQLLNVATDFGSGRVSGEDFGDVAGTTTFTGSFVGDGTSLEGVTSYTDSDNTDHLNSLGVISGSSQISGVTNSQLAGSIAASKLAGSIGNAKLSNSAITISGTSVSLGGSITDETLFGGAGVVSGSAQVTTLLPAGVVSGSEQITKDKSDVGLGNVDNTADSAKPVSTAQQTALDLKANIASPTFTGTPLSTTPSANDSSTKIATTAYVQQELTDLIGTADSTVDTLGELSASLAADSGSLNSLVTTVGTKLAKSSNLSDLANASTARTNLGVEIGSDVQAFNSTLATVAGGTYAGDDSIITVGTVTTGNVTSILPSGVVSGSDQVNALASDVNNNTITFTAGAGLDGGGAITLNQSSDETVTFTVSDGVISGSSQVSGITSAQLAGSVANAKLANSAITISGTSVSLGGAITDETLFGGVGVVTGSAQIDIHNTTGYVANENIDHTSVSITAGTGLNGGGTIASTRTLNVDSDYKNDSLNAFTASNANTSLNAATASYLTTVDISSNTNLAVADTSEVNMILSGDTISAELIGGVISGSAQVSIDSSQISDVDAFSQSGNYSGLRAQATTKGDVGLGNVTNESKSTMFASPTFTGTTVAPTPSADDDSTKIATTAYVQGELTGLIGGAPAAFDTLLEISASIANGDSDVVALTTTVGTKLAKSSNLSDLANASTARTNLGVDAAGTDNSTDVTLGNTNYLSISGQAITGGTVPIGSGGTGATSAGAARTALGVDAAGTDNSTDVTLAGNDYLTISGQEITANTIQNDDLANSSITINGSAISLGGSVTTPNDNDNTQLTQEQVEDFVGGMLDGTETGITVGYDDTNGNIDFVVASQTDENFTTADHDKLDGIEAGADVTDAANVLTSLPSGVVSGSSQISGVTSSQLAGSIANSKLSNDSVSFGGVSVDLGSSDSTPAFDLSDATNYATSNLSGTITNTQLAGSIAASKLAGSIGNAKLSNSAITISGTSVSLGSSIDDATLFGGTGIVSGSSQVSLETVTGGSGIQSGSITNADLAGSIANGKLANSSITIDGSAISLGGSVTTLQLGTSSSTALAGDTTTVSGAQATAITNNSAKDTNVSTNLSKTTATGQITIHSSDGDDVVIGEATGTIAGLMSTTHHDKLDGIETSADVTDMGNVRGALNNAMTSNTLTIGDGSTITTFPGDIVVTGTTTTNNVETVSTSNGVVFEGSSADDNEVTLIAGTVSADRTITLPNATGTVALTSDIPTSNSSLTNGENYISSFDITTQTDSKYLRSNANDTATGIISITNTTASTSKTTGALKVTGGVGISGALNVGGDVVAYASSDERLKDNIELISNPIEKVQSLKGVTWNWNSNADELQQSLPNVGVIAQDVEKVLPQLVTDRDNGFKGVDYAKLTGLLIEAIKDQQKQIDELKSKLS